MERGHLNHSVSDPHDIVMTTALTILTSERINQFTLSKRIRKGFGNPHTDVSVYKDTTADDKDVLVKAVRRKIPDDRYRQLKPRFQAGNILFSGEQSVKKEIAVLKSCRHPYIVQLLEVIDDPSNDRIFLVLEYLAGGEIQWRNDHDEPVLTVAQSRRIIRDVAVGLQFLHHQGIVHRDIKPQNLIWNADQSIVKIIDYGISYRDEEISGHSRSASYEKEKGLGLPAPNSTLFPKNELTKVRGTGPFLAPEIVWVPPSSSSMDTLTSTINGDLLPLPAKRPAITKAIDVWSLGCCLYCFLFGKFPFQIPSDSGNDSQYRTRYMLYREICTQDWTVPDVMGTDGLLTGGRTAENRDEVISLLDHMLKKDFRERASIDEVKSHPWVLNDIPNPREWLDLTSPYPVSHSWVKRIQQKVFTFFLLACRSLWSSCK